ncbi:MAG: hypothetical protein J6D45_00125 [Clostridia bacterium]|nr:hypothetical protein [Clostridia bacterium]
MKDSRSPKREDAGLDLLEMLGNAEVKFTDKAFDTDSKEKFNNLCSKKKERSLHRYALAASLSLFVSVSVLFVLAFGNYGKKAKPESGNVRLTQEKTQDEIFAPIEGRVVITSGDMWNYYAARKAIYDFTSVMHGDAALPERYTDFENSVALIEDPEEPNRPPESGYGVTDGEVSLPNVSENDAVYYDLNEFGELRITGATYFRVEIKDKNGIVASRIGVGVAEVVITQISDFDSMITFKNGDKYYSFLENGLNEFSTHKYIEGFFVVKNEGADTGSYTIEYDRKGNVLSVKCKISSQKHLMTDVIDVIEGTTVSVSADTGYSIDELEEFFNSKGV